MTPHPAFPQPTIPNPPVWRYLDSFKFEWLLENQRLFMPAAANLGDPYEGSVPKGNLDWWDNKQRLEPERQAVWEHNRKFYKRFAGFFRDHSFVSCWHLNDHENYAMWDRYCRTERAVAVQVDYDELANWLPAGSNMGIVRYADYTTHVIDDPNIFHFLTHKRIEYRDEAEVRIVAHPPAIPQLGLDEFNLHLFQNSNGSGLVFAPAFNPASFIRKVLIHPAADASYQTLVDQQCRQYGLPIPRMSLRNSHPPT
jgi:hypothetical protein